MGTEAPRPLVAGHVTGIGVRLGILVTEAAVVALGALVGAAAQADGDAVRVGSVLGVGGGIGVLVSWLLLLTAGFFRPSLSVWWMVRAAAVSEEGHAPAGPAWWARAALEPVDLVIGWAWLLAPDETGHGRRSLADRATGLVVVRRAQRTSLDPADRWLLGLPSQGRASWAALTGLRPADPAQVFAVAPIPVLAGALRSSELAELRTALARARSLEPSARAALCDRWAVVVRQRVAAAATVQSGYLLDALASAVVQSGVERGLAIERAGVMPAPGRAGPTADG